MKLAAGAFLFLSLTSCASANRSADTDVCLQQSMRTGDVCVVTTELRQGSKSYFVLTVGDERRIVSVSDGNINEIISLPAVDYSDVRLILLQGGGSNGGDVLVLEDHYYETEPGDTIYQWQLIDMSLRREFGIISATDMPSAKLRAHAWLIIANEGMPDAGATALWKCYSIQAGSLNMKDSSTCQ